MRWVTGIVHAGYDALNVKLATVDVCLWGSIGFVLLLHHLLLGKRILILICFTFSAKVAEEKIRYAAYNCLAIDTDVSPWEE